MSMSPQPGVDDPHLLRRAPAVTIIADDLTGANDSGLQFANLGLPTIVCLGDPSIEQIDGAAVFVVDTETRAVETDAARSLLIRLVERLPAIKSSAAVYKKIDSTMRGHVGLEISVLAEAIGADVVFMTPAFPAMRRTVEQGQLLVDGVPVDRTAIAHDPACPVTDASLLRLLTPHMTDTAIIEVRRSELAEPTALAARLTRIRETRGRLCAIFDAGTDDDLARIARFGAGWAEENGHRVLWAGSAGLAAQLPSIWGVVTRPTVPPQLLPATRPPLLVMGSVNPVSIGQLRELVEANTAVPVVLSPDRLLDPREQALEIDRAYAALEERIAAEDRILVLTTAHARTDVDRTLALAAQRGMTRFEAGRRIAKGLAACTGMLIARGRVDRLIATGGDTSRAVMDLAGIGAVAIEGALAPGVPLVRTRSDPVCHIVTKSGGFGPPDTLMRAMNFLRLGKLES